MRINSFTACRALNKLGYNNPKSAVYYSICIKEIRSEDYLELPGDIDFHDSDEYYRDCREYYPMPTQSECVDFLLNLGAEIKISKEVEITIALKGTVYRNKTSLLSGGYEVTLNYALKSILESIWEQM